MVARRKAKTTIKCIYVIFKRFKNLNYVSQTRINSFIGICLCFGALELINIR